MKALTVLAVVAAVLVGPATGEAKAKPTLGFGHGGGINLSQGFKFELAPGVGFGYRIGAGVGYGLRGGLGQGIGGGLGYGIGGGLDYHYGLGIGGYGGKSIGRRRREAEPTAGADPGFAAGHRNRHQKSFTATLPSFGLGYGGLGYGGYKFGGIGYQR